jgi:hypothetical protein
MQQNLALAFAVAAALIVAFLLFAKSPIAVLPVGIHLPGAQLSHPALQPTGRVLTTQ